jgi:hypothetical protein
MGIGAVVRGPLKRRILNRRCRFKGVKELSKEVASLLDSLWGLSPQEHFDSSGKGGKRETTAHGCFWTRCSSKYTAGHKSSKYAVRHVVARTVL